VDRAWAKEREGGAAGKVDFEVSGDGQRAMRLVAGDGE
jgi:hypothetical protein